MRIISPIYAMTHALWMHLPSRTSQVEESPSRQPSPGPPNRLALTWELFACHCEVLKKLLAWAVSSGRTTTNCRRSSGRPALHDPRA